MALLVALAAAMPAGQAQESQTRQYELPNLDGLELAVPPGWQDTVDQPPDGGSPTIEMRPADGAPFEVLITPAWVQPPGQPAPDAETLRELVRSTAERIRGQVVEESVEIRRLQGLGGVGFYFVATDRAPEDFKYMNQGALQVGDLTLTFTILTNDGQDAVVEQAFAMLSKALHRNTGMDQR